jgi:hypothetical protein
MGEEGEAEQGQPDGDGGGGPGEGVCGVGEGEGEHVAPGGAGLLDAEAAEVAQGRLQQDDGREQVEEVAADDRPGVNPQEVVAEHPSIGEAVGAAGEDEVGPPELSDSSVDGLGHRRRIRDARSGREDDGVVAVHRAGEQHEDEAGQRRGDRADVAQPSGRQAAEPAREGARRHADGQRDETCENGGADEGLARHQQPPAHVSPEVIGAEPVACRRQAAGSGGVDVADDVVARHEAE